jgi:hypothetical protein
MKYNIIPSTFGVNDPSPSHVSLSVACLYCLIYPYIYIYIHNYLSLSKEDVVQRANELAVMMGMSQPPYISKRAASMLGLKGVKGVAVK